MQKMYGGKACERLRGRSQRMQATPLDDDTSLVPVEERG